MLQQEFPGADLFVRTLDAAVSLRDETAITDALRSALCKLIREQAVKLPSAVYDAVPEHYARREIYRSEELGYSVIAMTWGPGQGTPLHDHSGLWCVEGVWKGALEIVQYDLVEQHGERLRFRPVGSIQAGAGSAGSLIPPHEYHTIRNPTSDETAVSVHIYSRPMTCCGVFRPLGEGWFERGTRQLGLD
jgi:predicted metal-dependent enzyme (double-stranded beta helix superfamily)